MILVDLLSRSIIKEHQFRVVGGRIHDISFFRVGGDTVVQLAGGLYFSTGSRARAAGLRPIDGPHLA